MRPARRSRAVSVSPGTSPAIELSQVTSARSSSVTVTVSSRSTFSIVSSAVITLVTEAGYQRSSEPWSSRTVPVSRSISRA